MTSIRRVLLSAAALLCIVLSSHGQVRFDYDVKARMLFDNRENDGSGNMFTPSMTIFALRAAPEIGLRAFTGSAENGYGFRGRATHRFMAGVDVTGDFGSGKSIKDMFGELTLYYQLDKQLSPKCTMNMYAGIFSREKSHFDYGDAFISDSLKFYVFSAAEADFLRVLYIGYAFSMYHFANSREVRGVVDNVLVNPYVSVDFAPLLPLDRLSLRL